MLTALPLYHIFAFTANLMLFFVTGGRDILIPSPRPLTQPAQGDGGRARHLVHRREHVVRRADARAVVPCSGHPSRFRGSVAGGMALVPAVGERWEQVTRTPIYQGYGLTETSPVVTLNPFHRVKRGIDRRAAAGHRRPHRRRGGP